MGRASESRGAVFNIFNDQDSGDDGDTYALNNPFTALRQVSVEQSQNRQSTTGSSSSRESDSHPQSHSHVSNENRQLNPVQPKYKYRLTRPIVAPDTFSPLQTVPEGEGESPDSLKPIETDPTVATSTQHYLKVPGKHYSKKFDNMPSLRRQGDSTNPNHMVATQFAGHPLSRDAYNIPSVEEQLAKHRDGQFEWVLAVGFPIHPTGDPHSTDAPSVTQTGVQNVYFGCNLLPSPEQPPQDNAMKNPAADTYVLLVTPIDEDEEPLKMELRPPEQDIVPKEVRKEESTPRKVLVTSHEDELIQFTPSSVKSNGEHGSPMSISTSRSPSRRFSRIEDSVEALDELEDQLEEFDQAAHFHRVSSQGKRKSTAGRPSTDAPSASINRDVKATAPQPKRTTMLKTGSATVRVKPTDEIKRTPSIRKSASMNFLSSGSSEVKDKEKPLVRSPSFKQTAVTRPTSLNPPKQPVKSTRPPTIPSFELPGDATARRLKEKREARVAMQAAAEQASKSAAQASSLRRTKSARAPTRPTFELPGEAISRRKREEHEAQLRMQGEEERRRREFKARPIRSSATPNSYPRETIASRARQQNKTSTAENTTYHPTSLSPNKGNFYTRSRSPLSSNMNASQPRGRGLHAESDAPRLARAASHASSTGSGKRSMLSAEDLEQQRLRGQIIYKRDNSFSEERAREKKEREMLAKLAREEAAEKSRQRSREWAAKQTQKRMTIASLRDIAT